MEKVIKIAVIGDFDDSRPSHVATHKALQHSASALSTNIEIDWISTHPLENINNSKTLKFGYKCNEKTKPSSVEASEGLYILCKIVIYLKALMSKNNLIIPHCSF